jgi:predicted nucleotidyltransferase component of viral defense system
VIPRADIIAWQEHAPWADEAQVEQDLVLCRAVVDLFQDERARKGLAFRGGTALHKLHLAPPVRYSEDIDLVQVAAGPIKPMFDAIRERLDPWLGKPSRERKRDSAKLIYRFETEGPPVRSMRVKIEINTREHFSVLGLVTKRFEVATRWFAGATDVPTYHLDELLGTKLRALYQRRKGRDAFDLWEAPRRAAVDLGAVVRCFRAYLDHRRLTISRADFEANLDAKLADPIFTGDLGPLMAAGADHDVAEAVRYVREHLLVRL